jgi:L-asparaginase
MPRVLYVFTGGTIAMRHDAAAGGAVPAFSGREILARDPDLAGIAEPEIVDYGRFPGPHMTPARAWEVSELLRRELQRPELAGAVVTHGTDTLEESAYLVDLRHHLDKPVAFTGALLNSSEIGFDGTANLRAATRVAVDEQARGLGVLVVFNRQIVAASEAAKTDTQQFETFQSPDFGPLGFVDHDRVIITRRLTSRDVIEAGRLETRVDLLRMYSGADARFIRHAVAGGARGLVIEGTGRGNVPPDVLPGVQEAIDAGVAVVVATRCPHGRVLDTYAYPGRDLRKLGVLFAGNLPGHKARIRLMMALACASGPVELREIFERGGYPSALSSN